MTGNRKKANARHEPVVDKRPCGYPRRNKKNPDRGRKHSLTPFFHALLAGRNKKNPDRGRKLVTLYPIVENTLCRNKKNPDRGRKL